MLTITSVIESVSEDQLRDKDPDALVLTAEQRRWLRGRFTTQHGRRVALAFPTGTTLEPGAVLWIEPEWYLTVQAAAEPVLVVLTPDWHTAVRVAFEVGNRHFPIAVEPDRLLIPEDPAMVQLLDRIGVTWARGQAVFRPIGNAHRHEH
jgi:urease accessory protein